LDKKV
jgi:zinc finger protein 185